MKTKDIIGALLVAVPLVVWLVSFLLCIGSCTVNWPLMIVILVCIVIGFVVLMTGNTED